MAEQTIAAYGNTFSLRPNRQGGCYTSRVGESSWTEEGQPTQGSA